MTGFCRNEDTRMQAVEGIEKVDVIEAIDEFLHAEQVERCWRDEKYGRFIAPEVSEDVG